MASPVIPQLLEAAGQHHRAGRLAEAEAIYRQILVLDPTQPSALHFLGLLLAKTRRDEALQLLRRAVTAAPNVAGFRVSLGVVLEAAGDYASAVSAYRAAVQLNGTNPATLTKLGLALLRTGAAEEAIAIFQRAVTLEPENATTYGHLGKAQFALGQFEAAAASYRKMLALQPENAEAWSNLGITLKQTNELAEGITACRKAIALKPDFPSAHLNLGVMLLSQGDFSEGWREYEWRLKSPQHKPPLRDFGVPRWQGEDFRGKRLLLHAEQGFGDTIQFIRYASLAAQRGAEIVVQCPARLLRLLRGVEGVSEWIAQGEPLPPFDLHCPLMSLPLIFGTTRDTIPANVPYLDADPDTRRLWRRCLGAAEGKFHIGLCWAGHPGHPNDHRRSLPLSRLTPMISASTATFYSLQKGPAKVQATDGHSAELIDWTDDLSDFADTAAFVSELDLVITVDTSVAHLAGALGKPVWVLLPFAADWRWLTARADSPWYPTMRLFRQTAPDDWESPLREVATALAETSRQTSLSGAARN